jgi:hypothetical protein
MRQDVVLPCLLALACTLTAQSLDPATRQALDSIRPSELKGDLSFLASDLLQGRYTPSPGLEIAAEFIASKFRSFGLAPGGTSDYFQLADMVERKIPKVMTPMILHDGDKPIPIEPASIWVTKSAAAANIADGAVIKFSEHNPDKLKGVNLDGKVVLVPAVDYSSIPADQRMAVALKARAFDKKVAESKALLEVVVSKLARPYPTSSFLYAEDISATAPALVVVANSELSEAIHTANSMTVSFEVPAPVDTKVTVKNVIGVLRGSDPALNATCILVTAHYDHIGTTETARGMTPTQPTGDDHIYNGANDDGSGTVSVIEIARALSRLHPERSIVFMTFFGEERGLLGSTYYGRHPVFPISKTVADINLEQVGRTDSSAGPEIANASITGYDYSDVTKYLEDAGKVTGIKIYKDNQASDQYFVRSDNAALAEQGVPAHTLTTAFEYPDYHGLGDEWQKIDYDNMAKVDRMVALAVFNIANARKAPEWNASNPKTEPFREAQKHNGTSSH